MKMDSIPLIDSVRNHGINFLSNYGLQEACENAWLTELCINPSASWRILSLHIIRARTPMRESLTLGPAVSLLKFAKRFLAILASEALFSKAEWIEEK